MENKNKNEKNLIKYSVTLLIVAIICIAIGGISMSRSINRGDERVRRNFNANDKVQQVSNQNLMLTQENAALKNELNDLKTEKEEIVKEKDNALNEIKAYEIYLQALEIKDSDEEKYKELINSIKEMDISRELKEKLAPAVEEE